MGMNLYATAEQRSHFRARAERAAESQGDGPELLLVALMVDSWHPEHHDDPVSVDDLAGCGAFWLMDGEPYQGAAVDFAAAYGRYAADISPGNTRPNPYQLAEDRVQQLARLGNRAAIEVDWLSEQLGRERSERFGYSQLRALVSGEQPRPRRASALAG